MALFGLINNKPEPKILAQSENMSFVPIDKNGNIGVVNTETLGAKVPDTVRSFSLADVAKAKESAKPKIDPSTMQASLSELHPNLAPNTSEIAPMKVEGTPIPSVVTTLETADTTPAQDMGAPIDLPVETQEVTQAAPISEAESPAVKVEINEPAITKPIETTETKIDTNAEPELKGKALLNKFLAEVGEFFTLNGQLESIKSDLDSKKEENQVIAANFTTIQNDAKSIKEAIQTLQVVNDGPEGEAALADAVAAFSKYQETLDKQIADEKSRLNTTANKSLVELNGIKAKLKKITDLFGGTEKQKELLETIYKMNKVFERGLKKMDLSKDQESFVKGKMKTFFEAKDEMIAKDTEGVKMLMQSGDILGVLTLWVNEWATNNQIK